MKKLMERIKKNNKGFTLVELIVVVAVLAIITVVVAPQYLQYVEKARIGTDENAIGEIAHIAEISYVENQSLATPKTDADVQFTATTTGISFATGDLETTVQQIVATGQYKFKSEKYTKTTPNITITISNGVATWSAAGK